MRSIGIGRGLAVVGLIGAVGAACGGGSGGGASGGLASGGNYSVAGALSEIPADVGSDDVFIVTGDLTAATEAAGLERPDALGDVPEWLGLLTSGPGSADLDPGVFVPLGEYSGSGHSAFKFEEFEDEVGYSILDVDAFVEFATPPEIFAVVTGDLDADSLSDELVDLGDGVVSHGDGDDLQANFEDASAVSRVGVPVRFAEDGGRIALSSSTPAVEDWLAGGDESVSTPLGEIADALDGAGVYAAVLHQPENGFPGLGALDPRATREELEELFETDRLPPVPFTAVGVGWGVDDDEAVISVVFHHPSDDAAGENVEAFELLFDEGVSFRTGRPLVDTYDLQDVTADGEIVVVTLHLQPDAFPSAIFAALTSGDAPFLHA